MLKKLLLLFLLTGLISCSSRIAQNTVVPVSLIQSKNNQILFLSLEATKTGDDIGFSILDKQLVDGKLKRTMPSSLDLDNHLIFEFQSASGQVLTTIANENPLSRSVEVSDESGKFERKQIELDRATLVFRIQFKKQITSLKISDSNGRELTLLPLTL